MVLTIDSVTHGNSDTAVCNIINWNGNVIDSSGTYIDTFINANNCDSIHTLNVTVNYTPTAYAGIDSVICSDQNYVVYGDSTNADSVIWTTNGDGKFDIPNNNKTN